MRKWYKNGSKEKEAFKVTPQKGLKTTLSQAEGNKSEEKLPFHIQSSQTDFSGYRNNIIQQLGEQCLLNYILTHSIAKSKLTIKFGTEDDVKH